MKEIWKDIKGYEGLYQVSTFGRVKSLSKIDKRGLLRDEKLMSTKLHKGCEYPHVNLYNDSGKKLINVHMLVAITFLNHVIGSDMEVDHIDMDKTNNRLDNLRIVTKSKNRRNRGCSGLVDVPGVYKSKRVRKLKSGEIKTYFYFIAQASVNNKQTYIGSFKTKEEAGKAYLEFIKQL